MNDKYLQIFHSKYNYVWGKDVFSIRVFVKFFAWNHSSRKEIFHNHETNLTSEEVKLHIVPD